MELVKNSYDAMATKVKVQIRAVGEGMEEGYIEIMDDGHGMDLQTIQDVWCVIATPNRKERPVSQFGPPFSARNR